MDEQDVIVLDNGSGYLKVGFSGEDAPRAVLPTVVATKKDEEGAVEDHAGMTVESQKKSQSFFGDDALREVTAELTRPVERGEIQLTNGYKDALESLWDYTFRNVLGVEQEELPILIADPLPLGQSAYPARQWMADVMFEKFKVKSLAIFNSAVLSLFSTGRTRGLVVESGEGITQAVPVFEGYAIPHAIFRMEVAGYDITEKVRTMMNDHQATSRVMQDLREQKDSRGQIKHNEVKVMQDLKEKTCCVAYDYDAAMKGRDLADEESKSFELPDHTIIQVPQDIRLGAPEILFNREQGAQSIQRICYDAINTCDLDFRLDLIKSLVVAGGTSMLPGFAPRLKTELSSLLPGEMARQVDVCVDSQRKYAAWIGGSMFASLSTFDQVAITRQEYEDGKADVRSLVARKTF
jgi:actin-related protein